MFGRSFIEVNRRLSRRFREVFALPTDKSLWRAFELEVQDRIRSLADGATVIDVGGGRRCVYHHALRPEITLIAVDVSADELALNPHAQVTLVADASRDLPVDPSSADLIVSRAVLEHVPDVAAVARHIVQALKPGGETLHFLPCRYSLFAIAARRLPFRPLIALLHRVMPETIDQVEFDVYYDRGTPKQIRAAFRTAGLDQVQTRVTWAQPGYFEAAFPIFLLYSLYEIIVRWLRIETLAAYMIVGGRRPRVS